MFWWSFTQPKATMIWYLDSAHQNSWKTFSFSNSYTLTHQKLIPNQLYRSDKMMVHITITHIVLWWMIFHSTKSKKDLIFGLSTSKQLENNLFNKYALTYQKLISNQLYSNDKMMVHITKTHIILCVMIFHSTKSKNDLIFEFSISKQLENTFFQ